MLVLLIWGKIWGIPVLRDVRAKGSVSPTQAHRLCVNTRLLSFNAPWSETAGLACSAWTSAELRVPIKQWLVWDPHWVIQTAKMEHQCTLYSLIVLTFMQCPWKSRYIEHYCFYRFKVHWILGRVGGGVDLIAVNSGNGDTVKYIFMAVGSIALTFIQYSKPK